MSRELSGAVAVWWIVNCDMLYLLKNGQPNHSVSMEMFLSPSRTDDNLAFSYIIDTLHV